VTPALVNLFDDAELDGPVARAVRRIAVGGFHALWADRPVAMTELVDDPAVLAEAVDHLRKRGRIELADDGRLIAVHGLARRATPHRIEHRHTVVHTWCALDAIGIPAALALDACAVTRCPACGAALTVAFTGGVPQPVSGAGLWYPEVHYEHLVDDFCARANLFCSLDHLHRSAGGSTGAGTVMTIEEVAELGRELWADVTEPGPTAD
jgi:hypothetical protein